MSKTKTLLFTINLQKIDKSELYKTDKGIYLSGAIVIRETPDQFGKDAFITQSIENKPQGAKDPIVGNAKFYEIKQPQSLPINDDDLPF
jgi:hypothetical protein